MPISPQSRPRRGYADGPFGQVHFQETGPGDGAAIPLVLLHQAPMTSGQFDNVYAPLAARGIRAIGIDMPGFGQSDPTPFTPGCADYARVVPPVLDALEIGRAALLGHHTGALAASDAALQFPERIGTLILNGPLLVSDEDFARFETGLHQWELGFAARPHAAHMAELFDIRDRLASGTIPPARLSDYVVQALVGTGEFWWGHHAAYTYRQQDVLPRLTQPVLILTNTGDMIHDHAKAAQRLCPHFSYAELDGGGVDIVDQQPKAWADAVAAYLHGPAGTGL